MSRIIPANYDLSAAALLDSVMLSEPELNIDGIYAAGNFELYLVCPDADNPAFLIDGKTPKKWLNGIRPAAFPLEIRAKPPEGSRKVENRDLKSYAAAGGNFRNHDFTHTDLYLALPKGFPEFVFEGNPENTVFVSEEISEIQFSALAEIVLNFGYPFDVSVVVDRTYVEKHNEKVLKEQEEGDSSLRASIGEENFFELQIIMDQHRSLPCSKSPLLKNFSKDMRECLNDDEDFWVTNRMKLLSTTDILNSESLKVGDFSSVAMIDFATDRNLKITNYYSVFNHVALFMPPLAMQDRYFNGLGINSLDIVDLVKAGRLSLIVNGDIMKMDKKLLEAIVSVDRKAIIFPRKFTTHVLSNAKQKFPILYPPLDVSQKRYLLNSIIECYGNHDSQVISSRARNVVDVLGRIWKHSTFDMGLKGTDAIGHNSFGALLAAIWDVKDEVHAFVLDKALLRVQFASTLKAVHIPDSSTAEASCLGASIYTGMPLGRVPLSKDLLEVILGGLLTISTSQSPSDFAASFNNSDVNRLRRLVYDIAQHSCSPEEAASIAESYNREAKKYEKKSEKFATIDVAGLILTAVSGNGFVPPASWIAATVRLLADIDKSGMMGSIADVFDGLAKWKDPRAVLVARMQKQISWPNV